MNNNLITILLNFTTNNKTNILLKVLIYVSVNFNYFKLDYDYFRIQKPLFEINK